MSIQINNAFVEITPKAAAWVGTVDLTGEIVRLFNSSSSPQEYYYLDVYERELSVTVAATTSSYILVKSGSAVDSWNETTQIAAIKLYITSSELGNPFTEQLITTTGAGSWTKPAGVTQVVVECWGGGGSGGGVVDADFGGGGGAGGQYARKYLVYSSPSQNISYTVGLGGVGTTGNGAPGGDTTWQTNQAVAKGGAFGFQGNVAEASGLGGTGSFIGGIGDVVYKGGNGSSGASLAFGGPSGGGAGSTGNGNNANGDGPIEGGAEQKEYGGAGAEEVATSTNGLPGNNYGSGGGGALVLSGPNRSGGNGAQGLIRILYR